VTLKVLVAILYRMNLVFIYLHSFLPLTFVQTLNSAILSFLSTKHAVIVDCVEHSNSIDNT